MSRHIARPIAGYQPVLRIDMRQQPEGGAPRIPAVEHWTADRPLRQSELLVLVHGYNNHLQEASEAYAATRRRQRARLPTDALQAAFDRLLGDSFWPGDADWAGLIDKLDFLFYSSAVGVARAVGAALAAHLRGRGDVLVVHFLAHSLGCRVVLECIRQLQQEGGPSIGKVCLMAAAVPTYMTCPGGGLYGALTAPQALRILFSPADPVLGGAFPPGQTLAGEGLLPIAVGLHGDIPISPGAVDRDHIPGARHGDYWGAADNLASSFSEQSIADFFRFDGIAERKLGSRPAPAARPDPPSRTVAGTDFVGG
ncbi:alpha/beta hydrolase [Piscinibacter sakaiensis]|uniref:alpha/beta hydrolase n=1 Tax=Piscinibacter sakaiensis TaxID=1547922 RepID=UPI003AABEB9F